MVCNIRKIIKVITTAFERCQDFGVPLPKYGVGILVSKIRNLFAIWLDKKFSSQSDCKETPNFRNWGFSKFPKLCHIIPHFPPPTSNNFESTSSFMLIPTLRTKEICSYVCAYSMLISKMRRFTNVRVIFESCRFWLIKRFWLM